MPHEIPRSRCDVAGFSGCAGLRPVAGRARRSRFSKIPFRCSASLADDTLIASYSVSTPPLNARKILGPKQYPYMFDVVELFVTFSETGFPYYEFEVSPFNQTFQVRIVSHTQHQEGVDLGLVSSATILPDGWTAELKIPLKPLGWDGDPKENPREFLFHSGTRSTQLLEFVPAQSQEGKLSSAAVFSAVASM